MKFILTNLHHFRSSSSHFMINMRYENLKTKQTKTHNETKQKNDTCTLEHFQSCWFPDLQTIIFVEKSPGIFLICFRCPDVSKDKKLVLGLGDGFKNPEIMEFAVLGFSNNEIRILLYQYGAEKSIKLLKLLFKYIFTINGPEMTIIIPIIRPMIFLWFSYNCLILFCIKQHGIKQAPSIKHYEAFFTQLGDSALAFCFVWDHRGCIGTLSGYTKKAGFTPWNLLA